MGIRAWRMSGWAVGNGPARVPEQGGGWHAPRISQSWGEDGSNSNSEMVSGATRLKAGVHKYGIHLTPGPAGRETQAAFRSSFELGVERLPSGLWTKTSPGPGLFIGALHGSGGLDLGHREASCAEMGWVGISGKVISRPDLE